MVQRRFSNLADITEDVFYENIQRLFTIRFQWTLSLTYENIRKK